METFIQRLVRLRKERGLSQTKLSGPGATYGYISRIESGVRNPSTKAIRYLAEKLDVTPLCLETGQELYCPHCQRLVAGERIPPLPD